MLIHVLLDLQGYVECEFILSMFGDGVFRVTRGPPIGGRGPFNQAGLDVFFQALYQKFSLHENGPGAFLLFRQHFLQHVNTVTLYVYSKLLGLFRLSHAILLKCCYLLPQPAYFYSPHTTTLVLLDVSIHPEEA